MAIFQVYADESGKLADSKCVVFGSIAFRQEEASPFSIRWNEALPVGVRYVSMKEAMHFKGEFRGWKGREPDRDGLLEALAHLAWDRCHLSVTSPMITDDFRSLTERQRKKLRDLPYGAFEGLVRQLARIASNHGTRDRFHLIYDLSEEYSNDCLSLFNRLRMMQGAYKDFFASLSFADDTEFPPLQAADMLAYCERQRVTGEATKITKRILEIMRPSEATSLGNRDLVYRDDGLGRGVLELPIQF